MRDNKETWISCKDKLPSRNGEYLVLIDRIGFGWYELAHYNTYTKQFIKSGTSGDEAILEPHHWMPLPPRYVK